ncbi:MAG: VWA domain-containing protein [Candidatus Rokubacteria bacterium]|nr:VWA domain-containing protein [Candidatus Rokubacteria bacterium]
MPLHRYSRWDGSQELPDLDADDVLSAMSDDLMSDGDLWNALRRLLQRGMPRGRQPGVQDLLQRLRQRRQQRLDRFDLGSTLDDVKRRLDEVMQTEREGIRQRLEEARQAAERGEVPDEARRRLEHQAAERQQRLDAMPEDPGGKIRALQEYDFVEPEARRKFDELMKWLQEQMLRPFLNNMQQAIGNMTPEDMARMREMLRDLNRMLRERAEGREPDFEAFKQKWGQHFPGANSLDELLEQMKQQMAQLGSLLGSMSAEQRAQMQDMMRSLLGQDEGLESALAELAMNLDQIAAFSELMRRYDFRGEESLGMDEAMRLMDELQQMDALERQLRGVQSPAELEAIDPEQLGNLLGEESRRDLDRLRELTRKLEEAGYLERHGEELTLTARAIRKIGDRALREVFRHLARDRFGRHEIERRGGGGDRADESKLYEFGDPFLLDLRGTVMNAVRREGPGTPVRLAPADFEVYRTELSTQASTVVMLDLSRSMINNGYFLPAKKVALALSALIRGQFPRDALHIVGFSLYAREFAVDDLPTLSWSDANIGTNMHAGFMLSRQLLGRSRGGNKQILMITDGEPTAHMEGDDAEFSYPPSRRTLQETLKEVQRCTREGITINTFMLERSPSLTAFVEQMTAINRGRAFFSGPERLGEYVLVDYVRGKRRTGSGRTVR